MFFVYGFAEIDYCVIKKFSYDKEFLFHVYKEGGYLISNSLMDDNEATGNNGVKPIIIHPQNSIDNFLFQFLSETCKISLNLPVEHTKAHVQSPIGFAAMHSATLS